MEIPPPCLRLDVFICLEVERATNSGDNVFFVVGQLNANLKGKAIK